MKFELYIIINGAIIPINPYSHHQHQATQLIIKKFLFSYEEYLKIIADVLKVDKERKPHVLSKDITFNNGIIFI